MRSQGCQRRASVSRSSFISSSARARWCLSGWRRSSSDDLLVVLHASLEASHCGDERAGHIYHPAPARNEARAQRAEGCEDEDDEVGPIPHPPLGDVFQRRLLACDLQVSGVRGDAVIKGRLLTAQRTNLTNVIRLDAATAPLADPVTHLPSL